ncbi:MAG: hypothetical protein CYPHOPRED_001726 [Cyphobasidiales sp. Tagirdzhanova-0007]|nr:MAG: hypothetical protein CYPHOPRED_001726 [Cyphobasidiales sp. Tagirdzhanova-0007]
MGEDAESNLKGSAILTKPRDNESASSPASTQETQTEAQGQNTRKANIQGTSARRIVPTILSSGIRTVPVQFQHCEMSDVISLVASMLDRLLQYNDSLPSTRPLTRFHSKAAPAITPIAYLTRITAFTNVDPCILLILLYYIDKLNSYLIITSLTLHRFLIAAICCGSKALSDSFATNSRYAKVGGVELVEMNALEREFLLAIDWRLATSGALLDQYWRSLVEAHPCYQLGIPPFSDTSHAVSNGKETAVDVATRVPAVARPSKRAKGAIS